MKVILYFRVSTARQAKSGLGIEAQRHAVDSFCRARDCRVLGEYTETESGSQNDRRQLSLAIEHARATDSTLVIAKLDRLSRNAAFLLTLRDSGVKFLAADMPDANGLSVGILAVVAQQEREAISSRTRDALAAAKARGVKLGNPNGAAGLIAANKGNVAALDAINAQANEHASRIRPILDQILAEGACSLREVAQKLEEMGVNTPRGGKWHPTSVKNLRARIDEPRRRISLRPPDK